MRNFDDWLCTPPEPPEAAPETIWRLLIERAERDHAIWNRALCRLSYPPMAVG